MSQLALDLLTRVAPSLDNFVAGSNRECLQRLRARVREAMLEWLRENLPEALVTDIG